MGKLFILFLSVLCHHLRPDGQLVNVVGGDELRLQPQVARHAGEHALQEEAVQVAVQVNVLLLKFKLILILVLLVRVWPLFSPRSQWPAITII